MSLLIVSLDQIYPDNRTVYFESAPANFGNTFASQGLLVVTSNPVTVTEVV